MKRRNMKNAASLLRGSGDSPSQIPNWRLGDSQEENASWKKESEKRRAICLT